MRFFDQSQDLSLAGLDSRSASLLLNQLTTLSRLTAASVEAAKRALEALTDSVTVADVLGTTLAEHPVQQVRMGKHSRKVPRHDVMASACRMVSWTKLQRRSRS